MSLSDKDQTEMIPRGRKARAGILKTRCVETVKLNVQSGPKWRFLRPGENPDCRCPACARFHASKALEAPQAPE
jgi:hypothetical protein